MLALGLTITFMKQIRFAAVCLNMVKESWSCGQASEQPCVPMSDRWCYGKVTRCVGISSGLFHAGVSFGTEIAMCLAPSLVDLYVRYGSVSLPWPF